VLALRWLSLTLLLALALPPAFAGDDERCFAVDQGGNLFRLRCAEATVEPLGRVEVQGANPVLVDLAATPDGYLYGIADDGSLCLLDQEDPRRSVVVGNTGLSSPYGMVALGDRLIVNTRAGEVWTVDRRTGQATRLGAMGGGWSASGDIAVLGERVYSSVKDAARREHLVELDPATGAARRIGAFVDQDGKQLHDMFGLVVEQGVLYGVTRGGDLVRIDPATGRCVVLLRTGKQFYGATDALRI
jgi:hypothetical protein